MPTPPLPGNPVRPAPHPCPALTQLVGERQGEGGLPQGALQQGPVVGAPLRKLPVQLWDGQVTELPGGVGGAPALVPADAAASIQAGDLAEIYNMDLKVTGWKNIAATPLPQWVTTEAGRSPAPNQHGIAWNAGTFQEAPGVKKGR